MSNDTEILERVGKEIAETLGSGPLDDRYETQKRDLLSVVSTKERPFRLRALSAAAVAAVLVGVLCISLIKERQIPLPFWVGEQLSAGDQGSWIESLPGETLPVRFEGGSRLELADETAVRVLMSNNENVKIDLDKGKIRARIRGNGKTKWSMKAGPYQVAVMGTTFSVFWATATSSLSVSVTEGLVLVNGAGLSEHGISLAAGDHLEVDGNKVMVDLKSGRNAKKSSTSKSHSEPAVPDDVEVAAEVEEEQKVDIIRESSKRTSSIARSISKKTPESGAWKELYKRNDYAGTVDAAEKEGLSSLYTTLNREDLWRLASAARYARRGRVATDVLLAIRERFSGSRRAHAATFLLGRVALELGYNTRRAGKWFKIYLNENPSGPLAEEALGRLIDACDKAGDGKEARRNAGLYLSRYPNGLFTELARSVQKK